MAIDLAAAPPPFHCTEDVGSERRPPSDDTSWFARERALWEEYVVFLESSIDHLEEASGALGRASDEKDRALAAVTNELVAAAGDLARQRDELLSTREHLNLVESRVSYRFIDRIARALARHPAAFGAAQEAARWLTGAGRPDADEDRGRPDPL